MSEFPFPRSKAGRAADVAAARQAISSLRRREEEECAEKGRPWPTYDSGAFEERFGILNTFIVYGIISRAEYNAFFSKKRTIVEIGGSAGQLSQDLQATYPDSIVKTAGVTLVDHRFPSPVNHTVIEGDCMVPLGEAESPYNAVSTLMGQHNTDLLVSRMKGGLDHLPKDPFLFARIAQDIYDNLLSQDGMLLLELPESVMPFLRVWTKQLRESGIDARFNLVLRTAPNGNPYKRGYLMVQKTAHAPKTLPLLNRAGVVEVYTTIQDGSWENLLIR